MNFSDLLGKTLTAVTAAVNDNEIDFKTSEGRRFRLYHPQDCCEQVSVQDIAGDLSDLLNSPIVLAEESTSETDPEGYKPDSEYRDSYTWTFYRLGTVNGTVVIRWLGESNGYYSERVYFEEVKR